LKKKKIKMVIFKNKCLIKKYNGDSYYYQLLMPVKKKKKKLDRKWNKYLWNRYVICYTLLILYIKKKKKKKKKIKKKKK